MGFSPTLAKYEIKELFCSSTCALTKYLGENFNSTSDKYLKEGDSFSINVCIKQVVREKNLGTLFKDWTFVSHQFK